MNRLSEWIVKQRQGLLLFFLLAVILSSVASKGVATNFDMSKYLSKDMDSVKSLELTKKEFGVPSNIRVMLPPLSLQEAKGIKDKIEAVEHVEKVIWLDDVVDLYTPVGMMPDKILKRYYVKDQALMYVYFELGDFAPETGEALKQIEAIVGETASIFGSASSNQAVIHSTSQNTGSLGFILIPVILIILLFATTSWLEPFLFLLTLLIAIVLNNGTNLLLGEVSFITKSMSTALQLAISMDYAIFLLHRFGEERAEGRDVESAMIGALNKSFGAILASSLTTIVGFLALLLMQFTIGTDMGLVFAKGITISLITTLFFLPAITILCAKWIDKTHHKSFIPSMKGLARLIYKARYVSLIVVISLIIPAYLAQSQNTFIYGGSSIGEEAGSPAAKAKSSIEALYGPYNPTILLIPTGASGKEKTLISELEALQGVEQIQSMSALGGGTVPVGMLPQKLTQEFDNGQFSRLIVVLNTPDEGSATFKTIEEVKQLSKKYYGESVAYAGGSVGLYDIQTVAERDNKIVNWVAIIAVMLIIMLTYKSLSLPVLLVLSIEAAVFMNMSVPYFKGSSLTFIGMLVVSSLQLGSTIDYAILLTGRFLERRGTHTVKDAIVLAIDDAGGSILTSGSVLMISGFLIAKTSTVQTVSEMGVLIGRGTLLSVVMVFFFLPALLVVMDSVVLKTTSKNAVGTHEKTLKKPLEKPLEKTEAYTNESHSC